jgi:hypothetical protein
LPDKPKAEQQHPNPGSDTPNAIPSPKAESQQPDAPEATQGGAEQTQPSRDLEKEMADWTAYVGKWTRIVGVATALSVFVGSVGIVATIWFGQKADETARAAQRPWMRYDQVDVSAPLTFAITYEKTKDGLTQRATASTKVKIHLRNTGNSPALKVISQAKLAVDDITTDKSLKALCLSTRDEPKPGSDQGFVSFPGPEPIQEEIAVSVSYPPGLGPPPPHFFTIIGCITYRLPFGEGEPHQTGIIFNLETSKASAKPSSTTNDPEEATAIYDLSIMGPRNGSIEPIDLHLAVWHLGSFAN